MILPNFLSPTKNKGFTLKRRRVKANSLGFTLIELLVVIAIISILMSLGFAGFQRAQINARDAKRIQAMDQVKIALELYFDTNLVYPESNSEQLKCGVANMVWGVDAFDCGGQVYMKTLPEDPGTLEYCYVSTTPFDTFELYAQMENNTNENRGVDSVPAGCTGSYDYVVENVK